MDTIYGGSRGGSAMDLERKHEKSDDLEVLTE